MFCVQTHHRHHTRHNKPLKRVIVKKTIVKKVVVRKIVRPPAAIVAPAPSPPKEEPKRFYFF
jgi:hypothetical protein